MFGERPVSLVCVVPGVGLRLNPVRGKIGSSREVRWEIGESSSWVRVLAFEVIWGATVDFEGGLGAEIAEGLEILMSELQRLGIRYCGCEAGFQGEHLRSSMSNEDELRNKGVWLLGFIVYCWL
ncbi:hypothetical protein Droror1_Dr00003895 [Drosera rotundifolia]